jgi:hypothetical protein
VIREQRQLVRPHAGGHAQQEHAVSQGKRRSTVGDACAHGLAPRALVDRRARAGEAILASAIEDGLETLRL